MAAAVDKLKHKLEVFNNFLTRYTEQQVWPRTLFDAWEAEKEGLGPTSTNRSRN